MPRKNKGFQGAHADNAGAVVGRIKQAAAGPVGTPRLRTLAFGPHEDPIPTRGHGATREAAMTAEISET